MPAYAPDPLDFQLPDLAALKRGLALQKAWFAPQFFGLENIDASRPALYVGNHTLMGGLDAPLMVVGLYESTGVYLRSLADRLHFLVPGWRSMLTRYGSVEGSRANCGALMESGQNILVFPGGGREVMKNRGESYQLIWKERTGFAAMAMEYGYDIRYDANDFRASRLGRTLHKRGIMQKYLRNGDAFQPLISGVGGTLIPRPEKVYFQFGPRIPTEHVQARFQDKDAQWEIRRQVEDAVYGGMESLFTIRDQDADWPRWRQRLTRRG